MRHFRFKKLCIAWAIQLSIVFASMAQSGDYFLKNFTVGLPNIDNDNYCIVQDGMGRIRIANRQGLLRFDGKRWELTTTPGSVLTVQYDPTSNLIFVGCVNDFGFIQTDITGTERYVSLSKNLKDVKNIAKIEVFDNFVYFLGEDVLYEYAKLENEVTHTYKDHVINFFSYNNNIYACYQDYKISKLGIKRFSEQYFGNVPNSDIIFSIPINKQKYIVGTVNNKLYTLQGNYFTEIKLKDSSYVDKCELLDVLVMDENTIVIATTRGGCLVVTINNGATKSIINNYSGLPDNEIYALGKDNSGGVWIAHQFGLTRLDYNIPFRCFSNYLGLQGHIETSIIYNNKIYVGTNEGIFRLDEIKNYKEVVEAKKVVKKITTPRTSERKQQTTQKQPQATETKTKDKKRFNLRNLISKNKDEKPATLEVSKSQSDEPKLPSENKSIVQDDKKKKKDKRNGKKVASEKNYVTEYKTVIEESKKLILESIKYKYIKISTADLKCRKFIVSNNRLLASTNIGIFDLTDSNPIRISSENIRFLYSSVYSNRIYASTSHGDVLTYAYENNNWKQIQLFNFIKEPITFIAEDEQKNVWLSSLNKVSRYRISEAGTVIDYFEQNMVNPFSDEIYISNINHKIYFSLSSTYYYFDYNSKKLVRDTLIENNFKNADRILSSQSNILWVFKNKSWYYLSDRVKENKNYNYLALFRNMEEMIVDEKNNIAWVVSGNNQLYQLNLKKQYNLLSPPKLFINDIKNAQGDLYGISQFTILENESGLTMDIVSTDYYDQEAIEYQYKIVGQSEDWSPWSKNNSIILNHLSSGKYKVLVRSRNALGQITEKEAVTFKIEPPYWQTWWFYSLEIIVFGSLWLLSFRFNRKNMGNVIIRKLLTFITLVLTIELLSTIAETAIVINVSPVVDFLVKVSIAIILFPIEQLLIKVIVKR